MIASDLNETLDNSLIECLTDAKAAVKDRRTYFAAVAMNVNQLSLKSKEQQLKYKEFLKQLLSDATDRQIKVTVSVVHSDGVDLRLERYFVDTNSDKYTRPIASMLLFVDHSGNIYLTSLTLSTGSLDDKKERELRKTFLLKKDWRYLNVTRGDKPKFCGTNFNFKLEWFENWLQKAEEQNTLLTQKLRERVRDDKIKEIKTDRIVGQLNQVADAISQRVPGLRAKVVKTSSTRFTIKLYNVDYTDRHGHTTNCMFLPLETYSRYSAMSTLLGNIGFNYEQLAQQKPSKVPMYSLVMHCGKNVERYFNWNPEVFIVQHYNSDKTFDVAFPSAYWPENSSFARELQNVALSEIGGLVNEWLDYEERLYDALVAYMAKLKEIDGSISEICRKK